MSFGAGSLSIAARRSGARTVLERVRYDGIARCSRAFERDDAALIVLSQLGPGVVRGDALTTDGHVRAGAHLIVTSQSSTRLMGGSHVARAHANWHVEDGALLELIGEPLVAAADARYEALTSIDLGRGATVVISDVAAVPRAAHVRLRGCVRYAGRDLYYDAYDAQAVAPGIVGTLAYIGLADDAATLLVGALDAAADGYSDLRVGVGALPRGAFVRVLGTDIWAVRSALIELRRALTFALAAARASSAPDHSSSSGV